MFSRYTYSMVLCINNNVYINAKREDWLLHDSNLILMLTFLHFKTSIKLIELTWKLIYVQATHFMFHCVNTTALPLVRRYLFAFPGLRIASIASAASVCRLYGREPTESYSAWALLTVDLHMLKADAIDLKPILLAIRTHDLWIECECSNVH